MRFLIINILVLSLAFVTVISGACGYASCELPTKNYDPNKIYVHLIPHTHDDVGWLKTVDQYFYGTKSYYQNAIVQTILDSVIAALEQNAERKFTYVEMEFFSKWWYKQNDVVKTKVKKLINNGQLQFVLAGISMSDEAVVHYDESINQLTWGAHFLNETFGECAHPKVAWQIDPFGHARDQARIFYDAGFDAVFFQRIDYKEKLERRMNKSLELMWMTDPNADVKKSSSAKNLFTGIFYDSYCYPQSFCFDTHCQDPVVVADRDSEEYNSDAISQRFINYVRSIRHSFASNHILVPMGCDFTYENAHKNFLSTDLLIKSVNEQFRANKTNIVLLYSNPTCYTKAVNRAFNKIESIPYRRGDFFPYVSENDRHWSGFFTSRPALKFFIRRGSNLLKLSEHMLLKAIISEPSSEQIDNISASVDILRSSMGIMQHHDAITGTEKQHVSNDYAKLLHKAITDNVNRIKTWFTQEEEIEGIVFCPLLNITVCQYDEKPFGFRYTELENKTIRLFAYNPLGWEVDDYLFQVPITLSGMFPHDYIITVRDVSSNEEIQHQKVQVDSITQEIPERKQIRDLTANYNVFFKPKSPLKPLKMKEYSVEVVKIPQDSNLSDVKATLITEKKVMKFKHFDLIPTEEEAVKIGIKSDIGGEYNVTFKLMKYLGNPQFSNNSGAYIFSPYGQASDIGKPVLIYSSGDLFEELTMVFSNYASLKARFFKSEEIETSWTVGPIPDNSGYDTYEIIVRYKIEGPGLSPKEKGEFFTDSNGRRMIRRVRDKKLDWNLFSEEPKVEFLAGNYFPIVNRIQIHGTADHESSTPMGFAVYTDRAHGGSSLDDGEIEVMLHRRCMRDDGFGVAEALKETGVDGRGLVVRGTQVLKINPLDKLLREDRKTAIKHYNNPEVFYTSERNPSSKNLKMDSFALNKPLPEDIHLLSLSTWPLRNFTTKIGHMSDEKKILIRFESLYDVETDETVTISMTDLFSGIRITSATPMTVNSLRTAEEAEKERLKWPTSKFSSNENVNEFLNSEINKARRAGLVNVIFKKGSISTFICEYERV